MRYLLVCFALCVLAASSQFVPVCNPSEFVLDDGDPSLPTDYISDQFFYSSRGDIVEFNATYYLSEYFDGPGNRGRIETDAFGAKVTVIADYDLNEAFYLDSVTGECTVNSLQAQSTTNGFSPTFVFGLVQGANGTLHVGSPSTFLFFNNESVRYLGRNATIRGVPCLQWQTCTVSAMNTSSYVLDYYFSDPSSEWVTSGNNDSSLVLIVLKGKNYNTTTGEVTEVEHYYSYMPFQVGPSAVPDYLFQIPTGTACKGRIRGQELPPFPDYFSATSEYTDATFSTLTKVNPIVIYIPLFSLNGDEVPLASFEVNNIVSTCCYCRRPIWGEQLVILFELRSSFKLFVPTSHS